MSEAAAAVDLIRKRGTLRTPAIAEALGIAEAAVDAMLAPEAARGELMTCEVQLGDRRVFEYRASARSGGTLTEVMPFKKHGPAPDPVKQRLREWRVPWKEQAAPAPPAPGNESAAAQEMTPPRAAPGPQRPPLGARPSEMAPAPAADQPREKAVKPFVERVTEIFQKHGPLDMKGIRSHGIKDANASTYMGQLAGRGTFAKLGGGKRSTVYGLPHQKFEDRKVDESNTAAADKAPRSIHHRRKHAKPAKKRAGGSVAMRRKPALKPGKRAFRPALASDGAILLLGTKRGDFEIPREQARALVDLQRRLTTPEIADLVNFVTRLDNAEVGA